MADLAKAIATLKAGKPVIFPTDTVYGVGVAVRYATSPDKIYRIKGRDERKPIAWLVGGADALDRYGTDVPSEARALADAHWPGALTIVVKASSEVPCAFQSQEGTIGLRMPESDTALSLVQAVGPIAASSANRAGESDSRAFADLDESLLDKVGAWVEADEAPASGVASTVVDCSTGVLRIIRTGDIILTR